MWGFWIQIVPVLVLLALGFGVGSFVERAHFRRLRKRESGVSGIFLTDLKRPSPGTDATSLGMVFGEVVIASDYFKTFCASLRNIIGGRVRAYESLMERARREAILRMTESAQRLGADQVINVRMASSDIGSRKRRGAAAMVEIYAYGTAIRVTRPT